MDLNILRQNARQVVDDARNQSISPYTEWTPDELRELLVQYKIPIRDSSNATHDTLVRICDTVFGADAGIAQQVQESIPKYTMEDLALMDLAARAIQKTFFQRQAVKKRQQAQIRRYQEQCIEADVEYYPEEEDHPYDYEDGEYYENISLDEDDENDHNNNSNKNDGCVHYNHSSFRRQSMLRRINQQGDDYDEEINVEWRKPSWKFAKRFEAANRPHRSGGKQIVLSKYEWNKVTLGRHCYAGGCGEQLDLWNEGRTSEFSQFGSGVTNYFKVSSISLDSYKLLSFGILSSWTV